MLDQEILDLANEVITSGELAKSYLAIGLSPLQEAYKNQLKQALFVERFDTNGRLAIGPGEYITNKTILQGIENKLSPETLIDAVRKLKEGYPDTIFVNQFFERVDNTQWREQMIAENLMPRFQPPRLVRNVGGWSDVGNGLGGYIVPPEFVDTLVANLDLRASIVRNMATHMAAQIDDEILFGRPMSMSEAKQRVFDHPEDAALDAVGVSAPRAPGLLHRGFSPDELFHDSPTLICIPLDEGSWDFNNTIRGRFPSDQLGARGSIRNARATVSVRGADNELLIEVPCYDFEVEHQVIMADISLMNRFAPLRRVMGQQLKGTGRMHYPDLMKLMNMSDNNSPISEHQFRCSMGNGTELTFNGHVTSSRTLWGYPVIERDPYMSAGRGDDLVEITFESWGPIQSDIAPRIGDFSIPAQYPIRSDNVQGWQITADPALGESYIGKTYLTHVDEPKQHDLDGHDDGVSEEEIDEEKTWEGDEESDFPGL